MEAISIALNQMYLVRLGAIAHYNIDKALLVAGQCPKGFGWGEVTVPMSLYVGDRATYASGAETLPVEDVARGAVDQWVTAYLPSVRPGKDLDTRLMLAPGSEELRRIYSDRESDRLQRHMRRVGLCAVDADRGSRARGRGLSQLGRVQGDLPGHRPGREGARRAGGRSRRGHDRDAALVSAHRIRARLLRAKGGDSPNANRALSHRTAPDRLAPQLPRSPWTRE